MLAVPLAGPQRPLPPVDVIGKLAAASTNDGLGLLAFVYVRVPTKVLTAAVIVSEQRRVGIVIVHVKPLSIDMLADHEVGPPVKVLNVTVPAVPAPA